MKGLGFSPLSGIIIWLGIDSRTSIWVSGCSLASLAIILLGEGTAVAGGERPGWKR